ncbi:protein of unknown function [Pararobbsia alpina]
MYMAGHIVFRENNHNGAWREANAHSSKRSDMSVRQVSGVPQGARGRTPREHPARSGAGGRTARRVV